MSLLTIIQDTCNTVGIDSPTSAIGNTDQDIIQLIQLSQLEGKALCDEYDWDALQTEATFTTVAAESQGLLTTIAPGFKKFINETQWNRDIRYPLYGSITPQTYQSMKAANYAGPYSRYRIRGKLFIMFPAPSAGQTEAFEYITKNWISTSGSDTDRWTLDADTALIDEDIITLGTIWRWLKAHNMDYSEEFRQYEIRKNNAMAIDGGKMRKSLDAGSLYDKPFYPMLPEGNWNL